MSSMAEQICTRIAETLAGRTPAGPRVWRDRELAFDPGELPALLVECLDETTGAFGGGPTEVETLRVAVTAVVKGAQWQRQADDLRIAAHAALRLDVPLRELVVDLQRERCEWRAADAEQPLGSLTQTYRIRYVVQGGSIERQAL